MKVQIRYEDRTGRSQFTWRRPAEIPALVHFLLAGDCSKIETRTGVEQRQGKPFKVYRGS